MGLVLRRTLALGALPSAWCQRPGSIQPVHTGLFHDPSPS